MPVLGLVLTLEDGSKAGRGRVLEGLVRQRDVAIGDFQEGKLPVVLDVHGRRDAEPRVRDLAALAGVAHVDVVFSHFEDVLDPEDVIEPEDALDPEDVLDPGPQAADRTGESPWS